MLCLVKTAVMKRAGCPTFAEEPTEWPRSASTSKQLTLHQCHWTWLLWSSHDSIMRLSIWCNYSQDGHQLLHKLTVLPPLGQWRGRLGQILHLASKKSAFMVQRQKPEWQLGMQMLTLKKISSHKLERERKRRNQNLIHWSIICRARSVQCR